MSIQTARKKDDLLYYCHLPLHTWHRHGCRQQQKQQLYRIHLQQVHLRKPTMVRHRMDPLVLLLLPCDMIMHCHNNGPHRSRKVCDPPKRYEWAKIVFDPWRTSLCQNPGRGYDRSVTLPIRMSSKPSFIQPVMAGGRFHWLPRTRVCRILLPFLVMMRMVHPPPPHGSHCPGVGPPLMTMVGI